MKSAVDLFWRFIKERVFFDDVIRNISAFENSKRKFMGAHRLYQSWRRISRPEIFILGSLLSVTTSIGSGVKRGIIGQCTQKNPFLIQQVSNFVLGFFGKSNCLKNTYTTIGCAKKRRKAYWGFIAFLCDTDSQYLTWQITGVLCSSIFENNEITITWNGKLMQRSMKLFYEKYEYWTTTMENR